MPQADVAILGGGLAGLSLALQLKRRALADGRAIDVVVLERQRHPVPIAAHKVGESTVEIGAHYFADTLGLRAHLEEAQLRKFGFRFFFSDRRADVDRVTELGASRFLPTGSFQIDRGLFENALGQAALAAGVRFVDGAVVRRIDLSEDAAPHRVHAERDGEAIALEARWLVDASGRAGLIKRKLGLARPNGHDVGSVWFRLAHRIDVNRWSDDPDWIGRCDPPDRWRSTNHLCGKGYWVWLIPLASGSHSVGIVADNARHPIAAIDTFDKAMAWLARHQPRLHAEIDPVRHTLQDFAFFRRFSYDCSQVFDGNRRWCLTGEAGLFLDPFYSPGSDYIAMGNTFISELVARDAQGLPTGQYAAIYQRIFFGLARNQMTLYQDRYDLFGDPVVMPVKVLWDYAYYWGIVCQLWFQDRLTDVRTMARLAPELDRIGELNLSVQQTLSDWSAAGTHFTREELIDQAALAWFEELNRSLTDRLDPPAFEARLRDNIAMLGRLADEIRARAGRDAGATGAGAAAIATPGALLAAGVGRA